MSGMKLSRERKVYVAVLTVGVGVLGADQLMGGPASASASVSANANATENAAASSVKQPGTPRAERVALHAHLERMTSALDERGIGSAFTIDDAWRAELSPAQPEIGPTSIDAAANAVAPVAPKITMIVEDASGGFAVMNGQAVRIGERSSDGVRLVSLAKGVAVIEIDGVQHTIAVSVEPANKPR